MIVLGFDTATRSTSVALRLADGSTSSARDDPRDREHPGHATHLLSLSAALLAEAGVAWSELERIAAGVGPGRFTGLRVGVATARSLAQSLAVDLVGVSSLHALAHGAMPSFPGKCVLAVIDARRGEVFAAAYAPAERDAGVRELEFAGPLTPPELGGAVAQATAHARDGVGCVAVGDGALCYRDELESAGALVPAERAAEHLIAAEAICALGARAPVANGADLVPDYRREADAKRVRPAGAVAGSVR